jgi:simple sugar transport system ATP-binding protein
MLGVWKTFGSVTANAGADFTARGGEVHALLGENGAGKTTLMRILAGFVRPDRGAIRMDGEAVAFGSPADAISRGIGMVHQHFRLVESLTVAENVHLGWADTPRRTSQRRLEDRVALLTKRFGLAADPKAYVWQLSTGERQRLEILKVLAREVKVLILDEPTAVLTPIETDALFVVLRDLAREGLAVILITHKLDEVFGHSDAVTVMRRGETVATTPTAGAKRHAIARMTVGEEELTHLPRETARGQIEVLRVDGVSALSDRGLIAVDSLDLTVHSHEIVGIAGVAGNGQTELAEVLTGLRVPAEGAFLIGGKPVVAGDPRAVAREGVGHIPEDRLRSGLVPSLSIVDNAILRAYREEPLARGARGALLDRTAATRHAKDLVHRARIRVAGVDSPAGALSGGNQQRLVVHREMAVASRLLVAVHPTRGLDIAATNDVRETLIGYRNSGGGVLLISEDLDELLLVSDRILTMFRGRIVGSVDGRHADRRTIGMLMAGVQPEPIA